MMQIRSATPHDSDSIWTIFHAVVIPGDTYAFDPGISREDALAYWLHPSNRCYVAERLGKIVGTYILRANQPGHGSHVANAAFMVSPDERRRGIGRSMGEHSLNEARRLGFLAMQFNFVVSTNGSAVRLWQQLGFRVVGTLPGAFQHSSGKFVDAYVMYCPLSEAATGAAK